MLFPLSLTSCVFFQLDDDGDFDIQGYAPVYGEFESLGTIEYQAPQAIENAGKIFYLNQYLFIVESGKGIHIYDNEDPESPNNLAFISVPGCYNVAVKDQYLYVNNYADLVVVDVSDLDNVRTIQRFQNQLGAHSDYFPKPDGSYLCPDETRFVVDWVETTFSSDECYLIN